MLRRETKKRVAQLVKHVETAAKNLRDLKMACQIIGVTVSDYENAKKLLETIPEEE